MSEDLLVDVDALRSQVRDKYREVAVGPHGTFHFHTGRPLAARLGYEPTAVGALLNRAVESFAVRRAGPGCPRSPVPPSVSLAMDGSSEAPTTLS